MYFKCVVAFLNFSVLLRVLVAYECTPCGLRTCPLTAPIACEDGRTLARDPCGCCDQCTRLELELCGGQDWTLGYCGLGLTCAAVNRSGAVSPPDIGVCKALPDAPDAGVEDERCPLVSGCDRVGGRCVCDSRRSCIARFAHPDRDTCARAAKAESRRHESRHREKFVGPSNPACMFSGCNLTVQGCVCESHSCHFRFTYINRSQCQQAAEELKCAGVTCPTLPVPECPGDSVLTREYTPPAGCCPTLPPQCTCGACHKPQCPSGQRPVPLLESAGTPGNCCTVYECQKVSPKCVHNGKEFSEGEVYRMDQCWLCQCRGGISFCSKAECAQLDCDNFYIPEGECCPVCIDVELMSVDSAEASCWVNQKLRRHEEQWKEDDCTFCQCVAGETHCTAMACKQSCQNPVKIPGECCPFCEEPSYETVSPLLCPPLENCTLSGKDCPYGFQQDHNGCLLCQCLGNDSCPELSKYCSLQCPTGYEKDDFGCEVCECSVPPTKCRPLTCSKTCPYGYVRNKHGCEMCRCVKCPPFTCDKQCSEGYRQNRKGCSVCLCKESERLPSTTTMAPVLGYCLTSNGQRFEEGESWHDGCRDCYCHSGREMCVLISCPVPSCPNPTLRPQHCCPSCEDESGSGQPEGPDLVVCRAPGGELYMEGETWSLDECTRCTCRQGRVLCDTEVCPPVLCQAPTKSKDTCCQVCPDESGSGQPEGPDLVVCRAPGGELYMEGETWSLDECTRCTCRQGRVLCDTEVCPPVLCQAPTKSKDTCCQVCPEDKLSPLLPVDRNQKEYCISSDGEVLLAGDSWKANVCTSCTCNNGTIQCFSQTCPPANCRVPILRKGQCCPYCLETTTTSVPVIISTTTADVQTVTTESGAVWITTQTVPPVIAVTDGRGLSEDFPGQSGEEMALIYQSAAWILAGILFAIVIFLIVALIINKRKKWVQMSCYSAPKKTVILKKHVNKNSVVYMEPSKENKFQSMKNECGMNFCPDVGPPNGERMAIPRAKLSNGYTGVQH